MGLIINQEIEDVIQMEAAVTLKQVLKSIIEDGLDLEIELIIDDEVWECWALNTDELHPSVYSNFGFNSFCVHEDVLYGAMSDGIYAIDDSDTDNGTKIYDGIILPSSIFGTGHKKRFRMAYLGITGGGSPAIKVETDTGEETYSVVQSKAAISRGMSGYKWTISVEDFDELDFVELVPVIIKKR